MILADNFKIAKFTKFYFAPTPDLKDSSTVYYYVSIQ